MRKKSTVSVSAIILLLGIPSAFAQDSSSLSAGDTAWMLTATALVLFMTIPGLALYYGGQVQRKNVLSVLMNCFALTCVMSVVWLIVGYSLSVGESGGGFFGRGHVFHQGVGREDILESAFRMTFFIFTPALIIGTFVERMKFSAMLLFSVLWGLTVFAPICHITWFGGWFQKAGVVDLAGGIVVHLSAGVAALIACIMVGKRQNPQPPHNLPMTMMGTAMLWVGWFGFNGGSQGGASDEASMTLFVTHISAATAAIVWAAIEWFTIKKPSVLGIATGAIAGLAAITPASGVAGPMGALLIGAVSGISCWWASVRLKAALGYDDSLDVVGVHGVGGLVGTLMVAVVGLGSMGGFGDKGFAEQLGLQFMGAGFTIVYTAFVTMIILLVTMVVCGGLRVSDSEEKKGLDQSSHGESAYD
tara:strand:+ start:12063 stop:13313 length:1251 start_codon:yes stop_codon:yes gene_type:complete